MSQNGSANLEHVAKKKKTPFLYGMLEYTNIKSLSLNNHPPIFLSVMNKLQRIKLHYNYFC
jgi:hypothetical protein